MFNVIYAMLICMFFLVYAWSLYHLPILAVGVNNLRRQKRCPHVKPDGKNLPVITIVVPVKNEEKVIQRLLNAMSRLNYPEDKKEIIIVEDGSTDKTVNICTSYAEEHSLNLKILRKPFSNGKPSALNYGLSRAHGEIVGIFDADNVPSKDALLNVCRYFEDSNVAAVQGRTMSINPDENMLTKFISHEETIWCEAFLRGKDVLNLFVHLKGSCQFFRRDVLEELNGFDETYLSEDMEISARLTQKGYRIRYAADVQSWQESPPSLKQLFRQRARWFRGCMEVAFKYGKLMARPSKKRLDAEATLLGPFIALASLVAYAASFSAVFIPVSLSLWLQFLMQSMAVVTTLSILLGSLALIHASKRRKATSLLWLPFIYFYWSSQVFIAFYAMLLILMRRPRRWMKTEKSGEVTGRELVLGSQDVPLE